jgi:HEPN domain-containing protein
MNKKPKLSEHVRQRTKEWFRKAEHELKFLEHAPFNAEDPPTDTACRLAHMAAEYSLKAYLMLNKKRIGKIHELDDLLDDCIKVHQDKTFEVLRDDCVVLTRYKLEMTYPGDHIPEEVPLEEAKAAIEKARRIKNFVMEKAKELGY